MNPESVEKPAGFLAAIRRHTNDLRLREPRILEGGRDERGLLRALSTVRVKTPNDEIRALSERRPWKAFGILVENGSRGAVASPEASRSDIDPLRSLGLHQKCYVLTKGPILENEQNQGEAGPSIDQPCEKAKDRLRTALLTGPLDLDQALTGCAKRDR